MATDTEAELIKQTEIWTKKIKDKMKNISLAKPEKSNFLNNINAYIRDSAYFFGKEDYIRSFEAIVWAWSWLEIGLEEGILKTS